MTIAKLECCYNYFVEYTDYDIIALTVTFPDIKITQSHLDLHDDTLFELIGARFGRRTHCSIANYASSNFMKCSFHNT